MTVKKNYKPKSTTKKAKTLIRSEALSIFGKAYGYTDNRTRLQRMQDNANAYNDGKVHRRGYPVSDYRKGAGLVDAGCYRCYYSDQAEFLAKIYGKKNVETWSGEKIHSTYSHLIGREYAAMLEEERKKGQFGGKKK